MAKATSRLRKGSPVNDPDNTMFYNQKLNNKLKARVHLNLIEILGSLKRD